MTVAIVRHTCCDEENIQEEGPAKHLSTECTLEVANKRTFALYALPELSARFFDSVAATTNESRIRIPNQRGRRTSLALRTFESENVMVGGKRERAVRQKHAPSRRNSN